MSGVLLRVDGPSLWLQFGECGLCWEALHLLEYLSIPCLGCGLTIREEVQAVLEMGVVEPAAHLSPLPLC